MNLNEEASKLPRIWCDFNARGWSGAPDDDCVYVFDQKGLDVIGREEGKKLIIVMDDDPSETVGCVGALESDRGSWRIRPIADSWFREKKKPN